MVDSHHHVWDLAVRRQPWLESSEELAPLRRNFLLPELTPLAAAAGVQATVVVQTVTETDETRELLALAQADPLIEAVVGWTDLTAPGIADALAGLRALPRGAFLAGIRHPLLTEVDPDWIARPDVRRGLATVADSGLCFDLVLQPAQLPMAIEAAAALPQLTFVLDHLGNVDVAPIVDPAWAIAIARFASLPNTICKLSGILGVPDRAADPGPGNGTERGPRVAHLRPYYEHVLSRFGPDRVMFGSDWPVCTLSASYSDVVAAARALIAELSESEQCAILAATAKRVYRLGAH